LAQGCVVRRYAMVTRPLLALCYKNRLETESKGATMWQPLDKVLRMDK